MTLSSAWHRLRMTRPAHSPSATSHVSTRRHVSTRVAWLLPAELQVSHQVDWNRPNKSDYKYETHQEAMTGGHANISHWTTWTMMCGFRPPGCSCTASSPSFQGPAQNAAPQRVAAPARPSHRDCRSPGASGHNGPGDSQHSARTASKGNPHWLSVTSLE